MADTHILFEVDEHGIATITLNRPEKYNAFTKDIAVVGRMDGNFNIVAEGPTVETLFNTTRAPGKFRLGRAIRPPATRRRAPCSRPRSSSGRSSTRRTRRCSRRTTARTQTIATG